MKKTYLLYLFALMLLALVPAAHAQYSCASYVVKVDGTPWSSISGIGSDVSEMTPNATFVNGPLSNEITVPFSFRYINIVTNKIKITVSGSVIVGGDGQVPTGATNSNDHLGGCYSDFFSTSGQFVTGQQNFGNPVFAVAFPNETIHAWSGYETNIVGQTKFTTLARGTAPNRTFVVETQVKQGINQNVTGSWQVVLYEATAFISKIAINFGPRSNANNWFDDGFSIATGLKDFGGNGGFLSVDASSNPGVGNAPNFSTSVCFDNEYQALPTWNYVFAILYDENLAFTNPNVQPADASILLINQPLTPSIRVSNEGRLGFTAVNLKLVITRQGDLNNPLYTNTVDLSAGQIPNPFGGVSPQISFPTNTTYTPTQYGLYTMTWTVNSSTPTDQYPPDNTFVSQFIISPPNNVASLKSLSPLTGVRTPINIPTPISFEYRNLGVNNQTGVPVSVYVKNPQGTVVYRDTQILNNWTSSQIRDTDFKDFTPTQNGTYTICGVTLLGSDQNAFDDTACTTFLVRYEADVAAISVFNPDDQEEKPEKKQFKPGAYFQSVGVRDLFDVPVRCQIMRCSDNALVFQSDTIMPELNVDAGAVKMFFPAKAGIYDIANLAPGCYKLCAIAREGDDGDRTNDTACTFFAIIPRLKGDIEVGVGRRFQTISAATDSMRFRGIGDDLNLILTDATYTENGNTTVSSLNAAVEFRDILGTGPQVVNGIQKNVWVTWKPKKGVSPVITFTGSKQICFNYSYKSANYMRWDGNNQFSPTADLAIPEPAKRGITIVNNSTSPGVVFEIEFGRHDLSFRNLKLRNNGNLTSPLSMVVRLANIYTQQSFLSGVIDTSSEYNITIDNNEIGNANTAISDIGTVPLFDINQALFFDRRNHDNRITRNTIGTSVFPIGGIGVNVGNEDGLYLGHNEISWVQGYASSSYGGAIAVNSGNSVNLWIDANKIHNIKSSSPIANTLVGIDIQQAATKYTQGSGPNRKISILPTGTRNRITNNMIYDFRSTNLPLTTVVPISLSTAAASYFVNNDSIFNNSLSVKDAPALITMTREGHPFIWNNVLQNLNNSINATAVLYNLTVPRPMLSNINSNYNDVDFRNASLFASVNEYDSATGTFIQTRNIKNLNEWRTLTQQDISSVVGDPMFGADSLHLPAATTYIFSPASNAGAWLSTGTQLMDYDGKQRLVANGTPDIGADEFEGFQYTNDLAVQVITKPAGITDNAGVINVTAENPLAIQAIVRNLGSIQAFNRSVHSKVEVSTDNGVTWNIYPAVNATSTISGLHFDVAETKTLDFQGPNILNEAGKLFRVTVNVDPDQNNGNNSLSKVFKLLVKRAAVLLSYENSTAQGQKNKDSLAAALQRLGVPYDSLNRVSYGTGPIDYTPWWTLIWSTGSPATAYNGALGVGAVSLKEEEEIINFFRAGQTYAKKSFVIAGENIAKYNDTTSVFRQNNNVITDNELMSSWLHTQFVARWPGLNWPVALPVQYRGLLNGVGNYFRFPDSILSVSSAAGGGPNVIKVNPATGTVGDNVSRVAYTYAIHPSTPLDSGAGTAWTGSTFNVVFYPFDWSDPLQTSGTMDGQALPVNVSGTTRFLRGALDFIQSFRGTVLPVEFVNVSGKALNTGNEISWSVAAQKSVDHYEIEMLDGTNWNWVGQTKASSATAYSFLHSSQAAMETGKTFTYRIVSVDLDGSRTTSMTTSFGRAEIGSEFALEQNFPNPFYPSTMFNFTLPENGTVSLRILDITGKVVATPVNGADYSAGKAQIKFDASNLANG
ncbi:MAG: hypothetical protein Q8919_06555, partial [Bacteroidota bacterium]|nr:hypothetical protein [Bacteroidota bacterium]